MIRKISSRALEAVSNTYENRLSLPDLQFFCGQVDRDNINKHSMDSKIGGLPSIDYDHKIDLTKIMNMPYKEKKSWDPSSTPSVY